MLETMKCSPAEKASTTTPRERRFHQGHRVTLRVNQWRVIIIIFANKGSRVRGPTEMPNRREVLRKERIMWGRGESSESTIENLLKTIKNLIIILK